MGIGGLERMTRITIGTGVLNSRDYWVGLEGDWVRPGVRFTGMSLVFPEPPGARSVPTKRDVIFFGKVNSLGKKIPGI